MKGLGAKRNGKSCLWKKVYGIPVVEFNCHPQAGQKSHFYQIDLIISVLQQATHQPSPPHVNCGELRLEQTSLWVKQKAHDITPEAGTMMWGHSSFRSADPGFIGLSIGD